MNNNTSTFIGLGAIGTLIAYFGYQYLDDDDNDNNKEKSSDIKEVLYNDETKEDNEVNVKKNIDSQSKLEDLSSNSIGDISSNTIKLEVSEQIKQKHNQKKEMNDTKLEKPKNKWSNYWEDQYNNIVKEQEITVE